MWNILKWVISATWFIFSTAGLMWLAYLWTPILGEPSFWSVVLLLFICICALVVIIAPVIFLIGRNY